MATFAVRNRWRTHLTTASSHVCSDYCHSTCTTQTCHDSGMQLLLDDGNVFGCYSNIDETIYHSELGSSNAILRAGYNIASFMVCFPFFVLFFTLCIWATTEFCLLISFVARVKSASEQAIVCCVIDLKRAVLWRSCAAIFCASHCDYSIQISKYCSLLHCLALSSAQNRLAMACRVDTRV